MSSRECQICASSGSHNIQQSSEPPIVDTLDQFQITWNGAIPVGMPDLLAQSFTPTFNMLTRVQILVSKTLVSSADVRLSIRKELSGHDLIFATVSATKIPTTKTWIEFNFIQNISITPNDTYYIIFAPQDVNMSYQWWGYDNTNFDSYPRGEAWLYSDGTWTNDGFVFRDWCFRTYGYYASQPPSVPLILNGPKEGFSWHNLTYETVSSDTDTDQIRYGWDWNGDESVDQWTSLYPSNMSITVSHMWEHAGLYNVSVKAEDEHGEQSNFSDIYQVTIYNDPPYTPIRPNGTAYTLKGINTTFETVTRDPEQDMIRYGWDWNGDEKVDEWTQLYKSNVTINRSHIWQHPGTYYVQVKAEDEHGALSNFSDKTRVIVVDLDNDPPNKPETPQGPTIALVGTSYSYRTSTTDPNGDNLYYQFDWDDGTMSDWTGLYASGQTVSMSHTWATKGSYQVKVRAKDGADAESVWSDPLSIILPKTHAIHWYLLHLPALRVNPPS